MPLYDYDCLACGRRIEVIHGVYAPGPSHCPNCGSGPLKKAISAPAVHFRGTGWAKRDRRTTSSSGTSKSGSDSDGSGDSAKPDKEGAAASKDSKATDGASSGESSSTPKLSDAGTPAKTGA
jgi:putative FmdB family regulatory protein